MSIKKENNGRIPKEDWDALFPCKIHNLAGKVPMELRPAGIGVIQQISGRIMELTAIFEQTKMQLSDLMNPETAAIALPIILENAPDIIGTLSGLHEDDIRNMPLTALLPLAVDVLEVNRESLEYLQKNLQSLAMILIAAKNMGLGTSSKP